MEYNYFSENSLTNAIPEYNTLGEPNPLLAGLPAFNPYPSMAYQYKNVTNDKVVLGYDALSHGPYSGAGYGTYNVSYPSACSSYYVLKCPSQQIVQEVSAVSTPSPAPSSASPQPTLPTNVMTALQQLNITVYLDTSTMMGSKISAMLHSWGISKLVNILPAQNSGYKAEMMSRGGTDSPYFFSNSTGKSFQGVPSSIMSLLQNLSMSPSGVPSAIPSMPPMAPMTGSPSMAPMTGHPSGAPMTGHPSGAPMTGHPSGAPMMGHASGAPMMGHASGTPKMGGGASGAPMGGGSMGPPMMKKEGYGCQSCGVSKKKQPKIDNFENSSPTSAVVYFLFHSKRCGHCIDLVHYLENTPEGKELVQQMNMNIVDMDDLQKPEYATAMSHLQDMVSQVQGTPSLMRGQFNKEAGKFSTLPGDNPLLGKPMDIKNAYLAYYAEYKK